MVSMNPFTSILVLFISVFVSWMLWSFSKPKHHFPPGPKGRPVIGSLLDINNERPWITYNKWAKQYGDIVMYWVMGKPVLLLAKMEHAENLLQKRMMNYGDRPQLVVAQELVTQNGWYIGTARTKHETHKKQRRILSERLRANSLRNWAHPVELPEVHLLLQRLGQDPERFVGIVKCFTVNVMLNTTFAHGSMASLDNPLIERINAATDHQFIAQIMGRFWVDYLPLLKHLPTWLPGMGWKRKGLEWREEADALYRELWDATKKRMGEEEEEGGANECLVETLLKTQMHQISELEGTTISAAMVDAGTDTLTGTTIIFMIIFICFPHILQKAQAVVEEAVGEDRLPDFNDLSRIPYITAMIREAFRWRTIAPVAIPHAVVKDDIYAGYFIPKGTTVFALSQRIHEDEELYPSPAEFRPERFLDDSGRLNNLPHAGFGFGSRKCLGQHFAEQTLFLVISSFVWAFDITAPLDKDGKKILPSLDPMDWGAFLASPPPMNFRAIITPRSQSRLDTIDKMVDHDRDTTTARS
ncbi:cytochrome P450 [Xylariales sp. PMI_506]|nr:cytochrome P450 [Xylariales sp. PMI_506]